MGWSSGSCLFNEIITAVQANVPEQNARQAIYKPIILTFFDEDWETADECRGADPAFDAALDKLINPYRPQD